MKKKEVKNNKLNGNNGITLIALVITIIVLLILAGVTIATLTGDNGILTKASDASRENEIATVKEQAQLDISKWIAERLEAGEDATLNDSTVKLIIETANNSNTNKYYKELQDDKIVTPSGYEILYSELYTKAEAGNNNIKEYTDDGVPIPKGFYYVGGTKDEGVVISDNPADANKGTSWETAVIALTGNQFVWVPVENDVDFKTYEGYRGGSLDSMLGDCIEPNEENGYEGEKEEYDLMRQSVLVNNGFYVARYEASEDNNKAVSKQGKAVWNYIAWGNSMSQIGTQGAVYKAQQMYTDKNTYGVTSTLIYGVQWDAIMSWIEPRYKQEKDAEEELIEERNFVADSTGKGNYGGNLATTGSSPNYAVKNIYDLAGNIYEWTMEAYTTSYRVCRGGYYFYSGSLYPVSGRSSNRYPNDTGNGDVGFRVTLYL